MFVFLFCFGRAEAKASPLLISGGCCEQWGGPTTDLLPEDGGGCVWPPSGDANEFQGGGLGGGVDLLREYITGGLSGFEPQHGC